MEIVIIISGYWRQSNQNLLNVKSANVRHVNFIPKKIIRFYREITTYSSVGRASEFWSMGQRFESQPGNCFSSYFIILSKARSRLIWISFENGNWNDSDGECTQCHISLPSPRRRCWYREKCQMTLPNSTTHCITLLLRLNSRGSCESWYLL